MSQNKKEFIRVCPKCGSDNIAGAGRSLAEVGFSCCKSCNYEGIFPEVEKSKIKKFKEKVKERR